MTFHDHTLLSGDSSCKGTVLYVLLLYLRWYRFQNKGHRTQQLAILYDASVGGLVSVERISVYKKIYRHVTSLFEANYSWMSIAVAGFNIYILAWMTGMCPATQPFIGLLEPQ